jgi:hypothetical protein
MRGWRRLPRMTGRALFLKGMTFIILTSRGFPKTRHSAILVTRLAMVKRIYGRIYVVTSKILLLL